MTRLLLFFLSIFSSQLYSQTLPNPNSLSSEILHVEPPNWWYDMQSPELEIMIHGANVAGLSPKIKHEEITLLESVPGDSPNYLFLLLDISKVSKSTDFIIQLSSIDREIEIPYSLGSKKNISTNSLSITPKDAIYLITPDRFCNGNEANDQLDIYSEGLNRSHEYGRHGGDLEGIIQSLDYINNLGFNTIWLNPVLENNMPKQSYHGYATTDYYRVDARFGGNEMYEKLKDELKSKDMKLIMDMIANHCGSEHWWMKDLPFQDWLNYQTEYVKDISNFHKLTNHRKTTVLDPYTAKSDREHMLNGWFVPEMPDLNQRNIHMSRYIIQNSIWWVETMELSGIRQDTYSYPDETFLSNWSCRLKEEFPQLFIVGEEWSDNPLITSYWQNSKTYSSNISSASSCLPSVMDFPMQMKVSQALNEDENWNSGLARMYEMLVNDKLYADPFNLVIFPDNHDMSRIFTQLKHDYSKWKMAMVYFATMRGIPQVFYGTEILLSNPDTESHGIIRSDFPGGWQDDNKNAFKGRNMNSEEINALNFTRTLYNWRKSNSAIHNGKLTHYVPSEGVYVYFRHTENVQVMVIMNKSSKTVQVNLDRFSENLSFYNACTDIFTNEKLALNSSIPIEAMEVKVLEMHR